MPTVYSSASKRKFTRDSELFLTDVSLRGLGYYLSGEARLVIAPEQAHMLRGYIQPMSLHPQSKPLIIERKAILSQADRRTSGGWSSLRQTRESLFIDLDILRVGSADWEYYDKLEGFGKMGRLWIS